MSSNVIMVRQADNQAYTVTDDVTHINIPCLKENVSPLPCYTVSTKKRSPQQVLKSSKLASFVQLQFNSMNICLFSIKLPILVKICPTVIEILTFNKWS